MASSPAPIFDFLASLAPKTRMALAQNEVYRRFARERAELARLAGQSFRETGKLNSPAVLAQDAVVATLGAQVLAEVARIEKSVP